MESARRLQHDLLQEKQEKLECLRRSLADVEHTDRKILSVNKQIGEIRTAIRNLGFRVPLAAAACPDHEVVVDGSRYTCDLTGSRAISVVLD
jgi:hypothetical protein